MFIINNNNLHFPSPYLTNKDGILAIGGDLHPDRLIQAYKLGIFPWYNEEEPIIWWCPHERMVVDLQSYQPPKTIRRIKNKNLFKITFNTCFELVMKTCQQIKRKGQDGTWIQNAMIPAYVDLHQRGLAWSVEVWQENDLVGGLYGIKLKKIFSAESMFSKVSNASKIAFNAIINTLKEEDYIYLDCQVYNEHLAMLGAKEIAREKFLKILHQSENIL